jgi:quercetin dioxygenase-like cupin family protein
MKIDLYNTHNVSNVANEEKIQVIEKELLTHEQTNCSVTHRFGPGIYIREVILPAGSVVVGHYHTHEHLNIMIAGRLALINEDGTSTELVAPYTFTAPKGRKIAYVYETVLWHNVYATEETDLEKLEEMFFTKSDTFKDFEQTQKRLLSYERNIDKEDYFKAIGEFNLFEYDVRETSENTADQIPMPFGSYKFTVGDSKIEGKGVLATGNIETGEVIGPARINNMRTPLGRYTNHAKEPNAKMVLKENGDIDLIALSFITGCQGGQVGEEITVDYRQVLRLSLGEEICQQ